ncbi:MAG TPA: GSCFA domain-containing protein [Niabella sp.]|jgi:integrase|nr:GSCFA domain-containing protein [Chitinophagaceae bacterium]HRO85340.1 GSCFA domain-containing protein [Niabella sp.]HUN01473.1 GSCFA domain-containing protein [Niabella sp.]
MDFFTPIQIEKLEPPVKYGDNILLIGSCFTEHIGNALIEHKFETLQNPHGILFDPASVCHSLVSYIENKKYTESDLFYLNELWQTWHHHSRFSGIDKDEVLKKINAAQEEAHSFLKTADWVIITLGSSFSYRLNMNSPDSEKINLKVANCHRAPGQWFEKKMLTIEEIIALLDNCYHRLKIFNPHLKIQFTISPVRHLRDGVIDNNRSKARLIEAVHHIVSKFQGTYYFPAYELVIDVLRDYRFYDIDLAHPNYPATAFVLEKYTEACIDEPSLQIMREVKQIITARKHKPFQPDTEAHRLFLQTHFEKAKALGEKYPFLNFTEELAYFSQK